METWYNDSMTNTTALLSQVEDMNKSIYYTIQTSNPELAGCEPTILKVEVKVKIMIIALSRNLCKSALQQNFFVLAKDLNEKLFS